MKDPSGASFAFKQQALQVALWSTWLAGFLLIGLSLYATQLLPSLLDQGKPEKAQSQDLDSSLTVTIFSAPEPFVGIIGARQMMAVNSWLALAPDLRVVLFGQHPSVFIFAKTLEPRVTVDTSIDFTFLGVPMFHSMVARARASNSDIAVLIEPDSVLLPDFMAALRYAHHLEHDWLLVAMSPKVSYFPFYMESPGQQWVGESGLRVEHEKLQEYVVQNRQWSSCDGGKLWAWNTGELPLHAGVMPPFIYGKGFHDEWLLNEALSSDFRFVFDASEAISIFQPENVSLTGHPTGSVDITDKGGRAWEIEGNTHLAALYGSFYFRPANFSNNPVKLLKCDGIYTFINPADEPHSQQALHLQLSPSELNIDREGSTHQIKNGKLTTSFRRFVLGKRQRKPLVRLDQSLVRGTRRSDLWNTMIRGSRKRQQRAYCIYRSEVEGRKLDCPTLKMKVALKRSETLSIPLSLESLLQKVTENDNTVVLAVVGNNYRDMLMSWVCRLRRLKISNFIVCAVDHQVYQFAVLQILMKKKPLPLQGLPVFMDGPSMNISFDDCHFGTHCFQRVTKVKSRVVLQILQLGYHVLLSDVDVYWFKNPIPDLKSYGPGVLAAQSDEYNETEPLNLPRRLNSGFYFARSDAATITALDKIVKHAALSDMSEQPSFYDILCGVGGVQRVGDNLCVEPETNLTVHFLDRNKYPNGAFNDLWNKGNLEERCKSQGCIVLHNNWVNGRKRKLERQVLSGLWDYDASSRMCLQSWQGTKSMSSY